MIQEDRVEELAIQEDGDGGPGAAIVSDEGGCSPLRFFVSAAQVLGTVLFSLILCFIIAALWLSYVSPFFDDLFGGESTEAPEVLNNSTAIYDDLQN